VRRRIDATIEAVRAEELDKGIGAVVFQGFNTLLKALEVERKIREEKILEARLEALEEALAANARKGGSRWGA
jgi:hypothetical protein